jgi:hypothetical protein
MSHIGFWKLALTLRLLSAEILFLKVFNFLLFTVDKTTEIQHSMKTSLVSIFIVTSFIFGKYEF